MRSENLTMTYRLYHYPLSPFCRKLRLVLSEKKVDFELIEERYWERRKEFLHLSEAGTVPVLQCKEKTNSDGQMTNEHQQSIFPDPMVFSDSQSICEYFESVNPDPSLLPEDDLGKYETRRLVSWFDVKFHQEVSSKLIYERLLRRVQKAGQPDEQKLIEGFNHLKVHLKYMTKLIDQRYWLGGETRTLADFTAAAHISCLDYLGCINWNDYSEIKAWYIRIKTRPSFQPLLNEYFPIGPQPPEWYSDLDF